MFCYFNLWKEFPEWKRLNAREDYDDDEGCYSYGGGSADDTFSSHASPGCARIGRMLSSQTQNNIVLDRTNTYPY